MHRALQINRDALNLARSGRLAGQKASNKEARHCGISVGFQSFSFERGLRCSPQTSKKVFKTGWFVKCVALPTRHTSQSHCHCHSIVSSSSAHRPSLLQTGCNSVLLVAPDLRVPPTTVATYIPMPLNVVCRFWTPFAASIANMILAGCCRNEKKG